MRSCTEFFNLIYTFLTHQKAKAPAFSIPAQIVRYRTKIESENRVSN